MGTDPGQSGADHSRWRPRLEGLRQGAPEHHRGSEGLPGRRQGFPRRVTLRVPSWYSPVVAPLAVLLVLVHIRLVLSSKPPAGRKPMFYLVHPWRNLCGVKRALAMRYAEASFVVPRCLLHGGDSC